MRAMNLLEILNRCATSASIFIVCLLLNQLKDVSSTNATNPLIYTRLRHDKDFLQVYRNYQLKNPWDERKVTSRPTQANKTKGITFYINDAVDANEITLDRLVLEALDRTYLTRLTPAYLYNYDSLADRQKSSDKKKVSPTRCARELNYLNDQMNSLKADPNGRVEPEVVAFFNSYATEEPGVLFGNYHWTGLASQCAKRQIIDIDKQSHVLKQDFTGRYCIASIRSRAWSKPINEKVKLLKSTHFKYPEQQYDYVRFFRIQIGFCLPESCDSSSHFVHHKEIRELVMYKIGQPFKDYDLMDLFCLPDETSELRKLSFSAWAFIFTAFIWWSIIAIATLYDYNQPFNEKDPKLSNWHRLVLSMSIIRNYDRLIETRSLKNYKFSSSLADPPKDQLELSSVNSPQIQMTGPDCNNRQLARNKLNHSDLRFFNSIKVFSMMCIVFGHCGMMILHLDKYPLDFTDMGNEILFHFISSTVFFVDWFFVMTGFLTTYLMFISHKVEENSLKQWIYSVFHRYWRLAPIYIIVFWFAKSLFKHLDSGPMWDYGTNNMTSRSVCQRESWLWPITLTSNLHPIHDECIMPSWYISNDMQFFLITPFLLVLLHKSPIAGWMVCLMSIGTSAMLRILRYVTDPRADHLELMRPRYDLFMRNNWDLHPTYVYPQYRIGSYLIGILAGHYAYMVLSGKWNSPLYVNSKLELSSARKESLATDQKGKRLLRLAAFCVGASILVSMLFATWALEDLFPKELEPYSIYFVAVIYGCSHTVTSVGMSLFSLSIVFGQFPSFRRFLSWPIWTLISRINFVVYIIQVEIIIFVLQSDEFMVDLSTSGQIKLWFTVMVSCYMISPILTLVLELPLSHLEREFVGHMQSKRPKSPASMSASPRDDRNDLVKVIQTST